MNGHCRGFIHLELLLSLLAGTIVLGSLLMALLFVQRALASPRVLDSDEALAIAPSFAPFPAALRLQEVFLGHVERARAVYVLGGRNMGLGDDAAVVATLPLASAELPEIQDFSAGLPNDAAAFHACYAAHLGPQRSEAAENEFTVLMIGPNQGRAALVCMVQASVKMIQAQGSQHGMRRYDVKLCDITGQKLSYCFAEPALTGNSSSCGATHTWYRFSQAPQDREEGPVCVVFPDPWRFSGTPDDGSLPSSRFTHFLSLSP